MSSAETKAARRAKFEAVFDKIRDELIEHFAAQGMPNEAIEWYRNVSPSISYKHQKRSDPFFFRAWTTMCQVESSTVACPS